MDKETTQDSAGFADIQRRFAGMLDDGRHIFDAAANALLGGTDPEVIREDLFATDKRINKAEQQIRRQIVVNGTVYGPVNFPALLVVMSVAKDAERIGDYGKNVFDLAVQSVEFHAEEKERLIDLKDGISKLLIQAKNIYESDDEEAARSFLSRCAKIEDVCDEGMDRALTASRNSALEALTYRYFKRVASHASNVVTSVVMPLHKLDFFDES